jgi:hypothetical protein
LRQAGEAEVSAGHLSGYQGEYVRRYGVLEHYTGVRFREMFVQVGKRRQEAEPCGQDCSLVVIAVLVDEIRAILAFRNSKGARRGLLQTGIAR